MTEKITFLNPSTIRLPRGGEDVERFLEYRDKSVEYQIYRLKTQHKFGAEWVENRLKELKSELIKSAVWQDENGDTLTYSGLAKMVSQRFGWEVDYSTLHLPEPKNLPWLNPPKFELWPHQQGAFQSCIEVNHGGVETSTGSGKSRILIQIVKHYGLQTLIMTPSSNITNQLYNELVEKFGIKYVGKYGDGKKQFNKLITVATGQALTRLEKGSEAYETLSKSSVLLCDEAHCLPSETFEAVCMGIAKNIPYRYFFSATHDRTDGSELILKGITGPIVYKKSFSELVEAGVLAKPIWKFFSVKTRYPSVSKDPKTETRNHLYENPEVNELAATLANKAVSVCNRPTVILIEEFSQFAKLYPRIKVPFVFANGGANITEDKNSKNKRGYELSKILAGIPKEIINQDPEEAIRKFNNGEVPLIIGTSAVSMGVDLKPTQCLIYLQGGSSPIKFKQGVGRGTRIFPGKNDCWVVDFIVKNSPVCRRHALKRKEMAESLYGKVEIIGNL